MISLYRRHRPQTFAEVVGQEHVVRTLSNAVEREKIHHAYLFVGARGTGKTSVAKILARSLNCAKGPTVTPCGECEACRAIAASTSLDVVEMDAASHNSVEDIRELREKVAFLPAGGGWKVYILDEAHMLSTAAWNAFLKTLEEPPPRTIFVLATTEAHKVKSTIVDRCQRFDFRRPSLEQIATVLRRVAEAEEIEVPDEALAAIARSATGSFRDALGTLEQLVTYSGARLTMEDVLTVLGITDAERVLSLTDALIESDPRAVLQALEEMAASGADLSQLMRDLETHLHQLFVVKTIGKVPQSFGLTEDHQKRIATQAERMPMASVIRCLDLLAAAIAAVGGGADARLRLELALVKVAHAEADPSAESLLSRVERVEGKLASLGSSAPGNASAIQPKPVSGDTHALKPEPASGHDPARQRERPASAREASREASPAFAAGEGDRGKPRDPAGKAPLSRPTAGKRDAGTRGLRGSGGQRPADVHASDPEEAVAPEEPADVHASDPEEAVAPTTIRQAAAAPTSLQAGAAVRAAESLQQQETGQAGEAGDSTEGRPSESRAGGVPDFHDRDELPGDESSPGSERVLSSWPAVLSELRKTEGGQLLAALLEEARPRGVDGRRLVIDYPPSAAFHKRKAEDAANRKRVAEAVRLATGYRLEPVYELGEEEFGAGEEKGAKLSEDELVELITREFDAEEITERGTARDDE